MARLYFAHSNSIHSVHPVILSKLFVQDSHIALRAEPMHLLGCHEWQCPNLRRLVSGAATYQIAGSEPARLGA